MPRYKNVDFDTKFSITILDTITILDIKMIPRQKRQRISLSHRMALVPDRSFEFNIVTDLGFLNVYINESIIQNSTINLTLVKKKKLSTSVLPAGHIKI